jgi:hypothetical protein
VTSDPNIRLVVAGTGWNAKRWYEYDGEQYPTVTSILRAVNKPALVGWAAGAVAEYVAHNYKQVFAIASEDPAAVIDLLKGAPWRNRDKAASLGARVHRLAAEGGEPEADELPYVMQWHAFQTTTEATIVAQERPIVNRTIKYGGTLDLIMRNARGEHVLLDIKTGNSVADRDGLVYPEIRLQLAAYAGAEVGLPVAIDKAAVLHITPDSYTVYPVLNLAESLEVFAHVRALAVFLGMAETGGSYDD